MYCGNDFPDITPNDKRMIAFDFVNDLEVGETINSAICYLEVPTDPDINPTFTDPASQSKITGIVTISGSVVTNQIAGLLAGGVYRYRVVITTSLGNQPELYSHIRSFSPD